MADDTRSPWKRTRCPKCAGRGYLLAYEVRDNLPCPLCKRRGWIIEYPAGEPTKEAEADNREGS